ncbi:MAG TPA: Crp/Fnr family transcriptional regulator, partial [Cyclobacteriaceae bacterium]|nr:Crp/Fnr family transcriptional regulator [Cyclobacteriaceae bacterium]
GEVTRWVALTGTFVTSLKSFIQQVPSVENIQAMEQTEIAIMPRASWIALYEQHEFARTFWTRNIEENYIGMEERVFNLIAKTAEERYSWMQANQPRFIREVPDKYLASMLGIHPRHLTRIRALKK